MKTIDFKSGVTTLGLLFMTLLGCGGASQDTETSTETAAQVPSQPLPQISVQLWSVKDEITRDFKGTLKALAAMGFDGVEFFTRDTGDFGGSGEFGEFANNPTGLKKFLDQNGLKASSTHVHFTYLTPENFDKTVAFYRAIGCKTLIVPMDIRAWDPAGVHEVVKELNELAEKLAPYGMSIGYHNHAQEFAQFEDATYWDFIARSTTEKVVLQMDAGWVNYAGKDPVEYLRRFPGRALATHYKIRTHEGSDITPIIGRDTIDWAGLLTANIEVGGTRWVVVEQEEYPNGLTPLESVKASKEGLDKILANYQAP